MLGSLCARCQQKSRFVFVLPDFSECGRSNFDNARTAVCSEHAVHVSSGVHHKFLRTLYQFVVVSTYRGKSSFRSFQFRRVIMSKSNLFIAGSIHQGHERFSDISRGRQCFLWLFSPVLICSEFTNRTMDPCRRRSNSLSGCWLQSRSIPDTEVLSLNYLPIMTYWSLETDSINPGSIKCIYLPITAQAHDCDDSLIWAE